MQGRIDLSKEGRASTAGAEGDPSTIGFGGVVEWMMLVLLIFMPLAFGAVHAWSELIVLAIAGAMVLLLVGKALLRPRASLVWTWAYVPVALLVGWAVVQATPLPTAWVEVLSPSTTAAHAYLMGSFEAPGRLTVSLYPHATRQQIRLLLVIAAVFFVTVNVYRSPRQVKRLLAGIVGVGAAVAMMAFAQVAAATDRIYATVRVGRPVADAGPFLVREHYGQFICLCIGAALALLMVRLREVYGRRPVTLPDAMNLIGSEGLRRLWYLPAMILLAGATVFTTLSRDAVTATLAAGAFTTLVMAAKYSMKRSTWAVVAVTTGAVLSVLYVGFDALLQRSIGSSAGGAANGVLSQWSGYAFAGAGLGTLDTIAQMFGQSRARTMQSLVSNDYVRTIGEIGLVGLVPAMVLGGIIWGCYLRGVRRMERPIQLASFGLGFGLFAVMMHSITGSGLQAPAVACMTAACCGLLVNLRRMGGEPVAEPVVERVAARRLKPRRVLRAAGVIAVAGVWALLLPEAGRAAAAEYHNDAATRIEQMLQSDPRLDRPVAHAAMVRHVRAAVGLQPSNIRYRYRLALCRFEALYDWVGSISTARLTHAAPGPIRDQVESIAADLAAARSVCPAFGPACTFLGRLQWYVLRNAAGDRHIRLGYRLTPNDPAACFAVGRLDVEQGRFADSLPKFRRALAANEHMFSEIAAVYIAGVERADLALTIAGENKGRLRRLMRILDQRGSLTATVQSVRDQAAARLAGEKLLADSGGTQEPGDSGR